MLMARLLFLKLQTNSFLGGLLCHRLFKILLTVALVNSYSPTRYKKKFLLCRFIDRYVHIVGEGDGVKKVYMDGYLDNQLMLLGWLSHGMAMPVAYADGPFIISEITKKLVFGWTIVSSSFQDFAYYCTCELIFSNPAQKLFLLCRFIDRYIQIVGEGDGVKKVYMDGYLDNQLMLLGWLSHGMAMPVADDDGPFIIS
ncbi:hypothetical protein CASFOL_022472 [Castilleja foliolosa]|uniref:Uncharacterized protein n=1 Tax=Castilleja foliolosa TaxID=1961234 RepID=A0ABD3CUP3_9LAMI